ncbi:hypothetical protein PBI_CANTARE_117 [Brevibacterium phage Cantare]|uniref:Uncharacterized protein n=1 Tax=Brevibacterium phage Cantare TaxID=2338395 RepID=A0A3G3LZH9_9CAUD|nr:hypothetical protein PQD70_gp117 [Brevibacterium phage Cantare]AYQ99337.1 hypothetical protein PBI_CANTARE_117 [Brevibacterium phage Cantare]
MSDAVDTEVSDYEDVTVHDTPAWDNPKFGSVTIVFQQSRSSQRTQRISRATAMKLRAELNRYLD